MRVVKLTLSVAVILVASVITNPAFGCSCVSDTRSLKQRWTSAYEQFQTIAYVEVVDATMDTDGQTQRATLRVVQSWKGIKAAGETIRAITNVECCMCGVSVEVGDTLLVALNEEPYAVSACPGDDPTSPNPSVFKILDRLKAKHARMHGT